MGVQPQNEFEKFLSSIVSKIEKKEQKEDWSKKLQESKTLVLLDNVHKVKFIAWVQETSSEGMKLTCKDNTLKEKYVVRYEDHEKNGL